MEKDLKEACVHIYGAMGLYEEAVDLALKVCTTTNHGGVASSWHVHDMRMTCV